MAIATVSLFLDKRSSGDESGFIKWSVCHERKQRLFTTGIKVTTDEWDFLQRNKAGLKGHVKDINRRELWCKIYGKEFLAPDGKKQAGYLFRAQVIMNQLGDDFSFDAFAEAVSNFGKVKENLADQTDVIASLFAKAESMSKAGRIGNALNYEVTAKSIRRFIDSFNDEARKELLGISVPRRIQSNHKHIILHFKHLTAHFLTTYEQWMLQYGRVSLNPLRSPRPATLTTVGIYLRHLRSVVNDAIDVYRQPKVDRYG